MKRSYLYLAVLLILSSLVNACGVVSQPTPTSTPTNVPPTATPTEIPPSPTPTQTPIPELEGICANILYPLLPGAEWVYQAGDPENMSFMRFQVTGIENGLAHLRMIDEQSGVTTEDTVRCRDKAIINLPLVYVSLLLSDYLDGVLNTYQESGITAPSLSTFEENNWQLTWEVEKLVEQPLKVELPEYGSGHILRSNIITFSSETTGIRESVTVPAGTFPQAILVKTEMRAPITIGNSGVIFIVRYREWYEPNVGLLKIQTDLAGLDYTGMPVPVPLDRTLELVEYTEGTQ